ncbi:MAG: TetR/AcrR family transcriptional regulator [Henriciella sp.]|nr:TetR/AcrR family transcriptional regulator [Henriciella sp.]
MVTETHAKILKAASELLVDEGVNALNVRAISSKAGMSTIGIYRKFGDRQGVLDALCQEGWIRLRDTMNACDHEGSPKDVIMRRLEVYLDIANDFPAHYQLMFEASTRGYEPSTETRALARETFQEVLESVATLPNLTVDSDLLAIELLGLTHGLLTVGIQSSKGILPVQDWRNAILSACSAHIDARTKPSP